jgi:hypothetical protein
VSGHWRCPLQSDTHGVVAAAEFMLNIAKYVNQPAGSVGPARALWNLTTSKALACSGFVFLCALVYKGSDTVLGAGSSACTR